jgi:hypothetical protein
MSHDFENRVTNFRQKEIGKMERYPQKKDMKSLECSLVAGLSAKKCGGYLFRGNI